MAFVRTFTEHFQPYRHDVSENARQYACGLMQAGSRKNMDRMAEVVPESDLAIFNNLSPTLSGIIGQ
jgi:hypothetical protein